MPLLSCNVSQGNFALLLVAAVEQILCQAIRWSDALDSLQASIRDVGPKFFSVAAIGNSADQVTYTALEQTPLRSLMPSALAPSTLAASCSIAAPSRASLAILGMSDCFPGAMGIEGSWSLLTGAFARATSRRLHAGTRRRTSISQTTAWAQVPPPTLSCLTPASSTFHCVRHRE